LCGPSKLEQVKFLKIFPNYLTLTFNKKWSNFLDVLNQLDSPNEKSKYDFICINTLEDDINLMPKVDLINAEAYIVEFYKYIKRINQMGYGVIVMCGERFFLIV